MTSTTLFAFCENMLGDRHYRRCGCIHKVRRRITEDNTIFPPPPDLPHACTLTVCTYSNKQAWHSIHASERMMGLWRLKATYVCDIRTLSKKVLDSLIVRPHFITDKCQRRPAIMLTPPHTPPPLHTTQYPTLPFQSPSTAMLHFHSKSFRYCKVHRPDFKRKQYKNRITEFISPRNQAPPTIDSAGPPISLAIQPVESMQHFYRGSKPGQAGNEGGGHFCRSDHSSSFVVFIPATQRSAPVISGNSPAARPRHERRLTISPKRL